MDDSTRTAILTIVKEFIIKKRPDWIQFLDLPVQVEEISQMSRDILYNELNPKNCEPVDLVGDFYEVDFLPPTAIRSFFCGMPHLVIDNETATVVRAGLNQ